MSDLLTDDPEDDPALAMSTPRATLPTIPPPPAYPPGTGDELVPQCPHLAALDEAEAAPHRVVSSTRAALDLENVAGEADVVFLVDNAEDVLTPHATTSTVRSADLRRLVGAVAQAEQQARRNQKPAEWWVALRVTVESIGAALVSGVRGKVPLPAATDTPQLWSATLWAALRNTEGRLPDQLIRMCAAAASGALRSLVFTPNDPIPGAPTGRLSATWMPRVPGGATVIALADAPAADLSRTVGRSVTDITKGGPPGWFARAVLHPERLTGGSRPATVAARVRGHLAVNTGERVAVVLPGNRQRFKALREAVEVLLVPAERNRVEFSSWYDKTLPPCERVLALGVPAVPSRSVERRLEQRDMIPAVVAGGDWGEVEWTGIGSDGKGCSPIKCRGYRHPDWAVAYRDAVCDLLRRKLVGVSVPVSIVSDMDLGLGLPLVDEPRPIDDDELRLLEALRVGIRAGEVDLTLKTVWRIQKNKKKERLHTEMSVSTPQLAKLAGKPASTVRRLMVGLAEAGLAGRVGKRGGWTWPGAIVYPDYGPGEGTDAAGAVTTVASGGLAFAARPVSEIEVAVRDPVPADSSATEPAGNPIPELATNPMVEPDEPGPTTEAEATPETGWDPELQSLIGWFFVAEDHLPRAPFHLPRPGHAGSFVSSNDPSALYAQLWAHIEAGPRAAKANGLARNLKELYALFGSNTETQPADEPPTGAAA